MTLPVDRTAKGVIDANLVNGKLSDGPSLKASDDVVYNALDEIYNFATGLISAGTLSKLGIINVKDYNASGLATTAVGSITTGTKILTLTTTPDFVTGQGINLQGAFEVASLQVTGAATSSANCTVTLNGVAFTVALTSGNTAIQCATAIRAAIFTGWTAGGTAGTDTVTFTSNTTGTKTDATYSAGTTGATGTMTTTTQGTADQISTVSSVSGLVVNIADNSTRTIAAGTILHDDTVAIQAAVTFANTLYMSSNAVGGSLHYVANVKVLIPQGFYEIGTKIIVPQGVDLDMQGAVFVASPSDKTVDCFDITGNVYRNEYNGGTFVGFRTAFIVSTGNLDTSKMTFSGQTFHKCTTGIDTISYSASRSTLLTIEKFTSWETDLFAKVHCDMVHIKDGWITHSGYNGAAIYNQGFTRMENVICVPASGGTTSRWIDNYSEDGGTTTTLGQRGLHINHCRFGAENGGMPTVYNYASGITNYASYLPTSIVIENTQAAATGSAYTFKALIVLFALPNRIEFKNMSGMTNLANGLICSDSSFDSTLIANSRLNSIELDDSCYYSSIFPLMSSDLKRFLKTKENPHTVFRDTFTEGQVGLFTGSAAISGVLQVETIMTATGATSAGNITMTVTSAGMTNSPKAVTVTLALTDNTAELVAVKVRAALTADTDVGGKFTFSGSAGSVVMTAKVAAANDATLAFSYADTGTTGATFGASINTKTGYAPVAGKWKVTIKIDTPTDNSVADYQINSGATFLCTISSSADTGSYAYKENSVFIISVTNGYSGSSYLKRLNFTQLASHVGGLNFAKDCLITNVFWGTDDAGSADQAYNGTEKNVTIVFNGVTVDARLTILPLFGKLSITQ